MKLLPAARMISATSKGGRFISYAAFGSASLGPGWRVRRCRAACRPLQMTFGEMQVDGGGFEVGVAEQQLHGGQVGSAFQQVSGEAMPKQGGGARLW